MVIVRFLNFDKVCYGIEKFEDDFVVLFLMEKFFFGLCIVFMDGIVMNMVKKDSIGYVMFEYKFFYFVVNNYIYEICVIQKMIVVYDKCGLVLGENFDVKFDIYYEDI